MDNRQIKTVLGCLLHDIGKVLYRYNDGRNHSTSGYEFLKSLGIDDEDILNQVRFHHSSMLRNAGLDDTSLAYITWWADNVAAGADRRDAEESREGASYDRFVPLQSVFNIVNGNNQKANYDLNELSDTAPVNYPSEGGGHYSEEEYGRIADNIKYGIRQINLSESYINSLLGVLEANLSFVPSSSDTRQLADISLFDHMKVTAAVGSCLLRYLNDRGTDNYRKEVFESANELYDENIFYLYSMDMSGIQNFIYSVDNSGALKGLRAKSFYLEIMLEHIIDELLERLGLSRANLIYSGGGHAYILLPATESVEMILTEFNEELRKWCMNSFGTELYTAAGYTACSANALMNKPEGAYEEIFRRVSKAVSLRKASRYSAEDIRYLNRGRKEENARECRVCGRTDLLTEDNICEFCSSFKKLSGGILHDDFITVMDEKPDGESVLLPFDRYMITEDEDSLRSRMKKPGYIRSYSKNRMYTGLNFSTRLWIGDYASDVSFEALADKSKGIRRLGVLRADVDNLGQAFVNGFPSAYTSISRTATFSRKLNMFFKLHINSILGDGKFSMDGSAEGERNLMIVYSGGDDVFVVGAWNDVVEAAVDISEALERYTQNTLSVSAGIGLFPAKYPVKALARQTGDLEEVSKSMDGKNSLTLFSEENSYKWNVFKDKVIGEKYSLIDSYFSNIPEKGMSALYKLLEYIRNLDDRINLARLAYMLGRMEPDKKASDEVKELYRHFSKSLYKWVSEDKTGENRKQLVTAIYIYVYLHRKSKEDK